MAAALPNMYLKWLAFRELLKPPQSNAEIATRIWGPDDGPSKFSKLLRGDYGCEPDVAAELAELVNKRVAMVRGAKGAGEASHQFRGIDFERPVLDFARLLVESAGMTDTDGLDRAHRALVAEFAPKAGGSGNDGPRLSIEQFGTTRFFEGAQAAPEGPPVFEVGRHRGRFAIDGLPAATLAKPLRVYAMFARDPAPVGLRLWDVPFSETVRWFPSPFEPLVEEGRILLTPEPRPVQPVLGHFHLSVVVVTEPSVLSRLDPRGASPPADIMDEEQTARFLTNLSRVGKSHPNALALCTGDYIVRQPKAA